MKKIKGKPILSALSLGAVLFAASEARAIQYTFTRISNNASQDVAGQLLVDVTDPGGGFVDFTFFNVGSIASTISEIYFDDGFFGAPSVTNGPTGVKMVQIDKNNQNFPEWNNVDPDFVISTAFSVENDKSIANGVDPGEWVKLTFDLGSYANYAAVIAALDHPTEDLDTVDKNGNPVDQGASLRIGLHVQSIGTQSDSFINNGRGQPPPIPDGGSTIALLGTALFGAEFLRRRLAKA